MGARRRCRRAAAANAAILRIVAPPAACPACVGERGERFPAGYTTEHCARHIAAMAATRTSSQRGVAL